MREAPQGHRREHFLWNFLGEQKVPRRRQDARRAKKPGPQAQREQRPEGEEKPFQKRPGPQAQREQRPEGEEKHFQKRPGPQAQREQCPEGKNMPGRMAHKDISQLRGPGPQAQKRTTPGGQKHAGPQAQKKHSQLNKTPPERAKTAQPIKNISPLARSPPPPRRGKKEMF